MRLQGVRNGIHDGGHPRGAMQFGVGQQPDRQAKFAEASGVVGQENELRVAGGEGLGQHPEADAPANELDKGEPGTGADGDGFVFEVLLFPAGLRGVVHGPAEGDPRSRLGLMLQTRMGEDPIANVHDLLSDQLGRRPWHEGEGNVGLAIPDAETGPVGDVKLEVKGWMPLGKVGEHASEHRRKSRDGRQGDAAIDFGVFRPGFADQGAKLELGVFGNGGELETHRVEAFSPGKTGDAKAGFEGFDAPVDGRWGNPEFSTDSGHRAVPLEGFEVGEVVEGKGVHSRFCERKSQTCKWSVGDAVGMWGMGSSMRTMWWGGVLLGLVACSDDAGLVDGGMADAGTQETDAQIADAGATDAQVSDAGAIEDDAGSIDAGSGRSDAGIADAGVDAGPIDAGTMFRDVYPLASPYPESGVYDPATHSFYVGSLGAGTVSRIHAETGEETVVFAESDDRTWWTLGMTIDAARRRLWVCAMDDKRETSDQDPPYDGYLWVFDLETGTRIANHALSTVMDTGTCTDVAVTADGTAYVVDREHPNIYRVDDDGVSLFASDSLLEGGLVGQNALVVLPDESALLSVVYLRPRLVRIDLRDASVREVDIDGSFFDATPLSGADGMVFYDDSVFVTFASELVRVRPTLGDWSTAVATEVTVPNGMTDAIVTPVGLYLVNGQAIRFALGTDPDPFALVRFRGSL